MIDKKLGRFGHHPDPAIDFCVEVDAIDGMIADHRAGLCSKPPIVERIMKAMEFRVGGDAHAVAAKDTLRALSISV